ncbi:MAG: phosphoenolpyruvate synthase, partial [Paludibacter sp.]
MNTDNIKKLYFKDTSFADLMRHRIYNVLLYASKYDAFSLEEDGRIDELIFNEYTSLNLRYPPRFTQVGTEKEANKALEENMYDLIISMPSGDSINPFEWAKQVKKDFPYIPIVVLTPFSRMVSERLKYEDLSAIDYVFSWLGNSDLLLAIVKLIEDKMNVEEDVEAVGVQAIMLVEDSIRFYSSMLPHIYKYVFNQSRSFMTEALNEHEQMLRMRGRPKVLLARSYNEAVEIYSTFKKNMLGVITDVSYIMDGLKNEKAGLKLCRQIRKEDKHIPLIMMSTDKKNAKPARKVNAAFVHKLSKTYIRELRNIISNYFGFGDFTFFNPKTQVVEGRISNLRGLQNTLYHLSDECLYYHLAQNDISKWLYSRALFPLAEFLKKIDVDTFENTDLEEARQIIFDAIVAYRKVKNQGVVATFDKERFDKYSNFVRIGDGSMGGKGRGLAFIDSMIKSNPKFDQFKNTDILIPRTVVICTDVFTEFMEINGLYPIALSERDDQEILDVFLKAYLPQRVIDNLNVFLDVITSPLAVR